MIRIVTLCMALCAPIGAKGQSALSAEAGATLQKGLITTADDFILPAYSAHKAASAALSSALKRYCKDLADIAEAQSAFADTFLAWQRASIVNVGPIKNAEGPMRVQLWPDPKGFSQRAVRAALREEDPALLEPGALAGRSIALTNLMALEGLLFGDLPPESYACDLSIGIAAFQAALAADLTAAWSRGSTYRARYDTAVSGNDTYPSVDTLVREVLAGGVVYADRLRKFKLLRGLGDAPGEARAERTEATRSGIGLESIQAGFRTLADFYATPVGLFDIAPDIGGSKEYFVLAETAGSVADSLSLVTADLIEIADDDGALAQELRRYADLVFYHESYLKTGFPNALGLVSGFTSADGD